MKSAEVPVSFSRDRYMKAAVMQFAPSRSASENIRKIGEAALSGVDLLVLPELSGHGYFVSRDFLSNADLDEFPRAMKTLSLELGIAIIFGSAEKEGEHFYNSLFCCEKGKLVGRYRKMHLTDYEKTVFSAGSKSTVFTLSDGTKIAPSICFDLWFPEFFREGRKNGADLFVAIGAFGGPMSLTMAQSRAAENAVPLILANRSGSEFFEGNDEPFCGSSRMISYFGEVQAEAGNGTEEVVVCDMETGSRGGNVICRDLASEISRHSCK